MARMRLTACLRCLFDGPGDASNHDMLKAADIKKIFGDDVQNDMTAESVADEALKTYELFHINLSTQMTRTIINGRTVNISKSDVGLLPELIISIICKTKGINRRDILGDLDPKVEKNLNSMMSGLIF